MLELREGASTSVYQPQRLLAGCATNDANCVEGRRAVADKIQKIHVVILELLDRKLSLNPPGFWRSILYRRGSVVAEREVQRADADTIDEGQQPHEVH